MRIPCEVEQDEPPVVKVSDTLYDQELQTYIVSDLHFKSNKSLFNTRRCERFTTAEDVDREIISQFLSIPKKSIIILLGDFYSVDYFAQIFQDQFVYLMYGNHESTSKSLAYKNWKINELNSKGYHIDVLNPDGRQVFYRIPETTLTLAHNPDTVNFPLTRNDLVFHGHYHNYNGKGHYSGIYKSGLWPENHYINVTIDAHDFDMKELTLYQLLHSHKVPHIP